MDADRLLHEGKLDEARSYLANELRRAPDNIGARQFFWQLMCVLGDWEKALLHLRGLAALDPSAQMLSTVYGQTIGAESVREEVANGARRGQSLVGSTPWVEVLLDALQKVAGGDPGAGEELSAALAQAPAVSGSVDGVEAEWIADADPHFGPMLEAIIGDQYGFLPLAALKRVSLAEPQALRDTVWIAADVLTKSGQEAAALLPVCYPRTRAHCDPHCMMARKTEWGEAADLPVGYGQRIIVVDEVEKPLLEIREILLTS